MKFASLFVLFFLTHPTAHAARLGNLIALTLPEMEAAHAALAVLKEDPELDHDSLVFGHFLVSIESRADGEKMESTLKQIIHRQRAQERNGHSRPERVGAELMAKTAKNIAEASNIVDEIVAHTGPVSDETMDSIKKFKRLFARAVRKKQIEFYVGHDNNDFGGCDWFALYDTFAEQVWVGQNCYAE